jgi:aminoglycoside phosphotransferase family enzyme
MRAHSPASGSRSDETAAKVDFLRCPDAYGEHPRSVTTRQTHMSWVFLTDDRVYKLKKPVAFPFLDYSSLARREAACRAEIAVNRRMAASVYLGVLPLTRTRRRLAVGGEGEVVDWLVVMRRLPEALMLDHALAAGTVGARELDRLAGFLAGFYRHAARRPVPAAVHLGNWRRQIARNRAVLADPCFGLDQRHVGRIDRAAHRFLAEAGGLVAARAAEGRIVDGHGDLRPEHIFIGEPIAVIDRLEFNPAFRVADPFDELAFLHVECEVLGFAEAGASVAERVGAGLRDAVDPLLYSFYRLYRAAMRARLVIAHLIAPDGRSPERWRPLAARYLAVALAEAAVIERHLAAQARRPAGAA